MRQPLSGDISVRVSVRGRGCAVGLLVCTILLAVMMLVLVLTWRWSGGPQNLIGQDCNKLKAAAAMLVSTFSKILHPACHIPQGSLMGC